VTRLTLEPKDLGLHVVDLGIPRPRGRVDPLVHQVHERIQHGGVVAARSSSSSSVSSGSWRYQAPCPQMAGPLRAANEQRYQP
jgi:hypothetical protein